MEGETTRDWAALPGDALRDIFHRTRHADILGGAGLVCSWWRRVAADDPTLWRHIDLAFVEDDTGHVDEQRFLWDGWQWDVPPWTGAPACASRSAAQHIATSYPTFSYLTLLLGMYVCIIQYMHDVFVSTCWYILYHHACRAPSLRRLDVASCWCLPEALEDRVIPKLQMLEELVLSWGGLLLLSTLRALLEHCPPPPSARHRRALLHRRTDGVRAVAEVPNQVQGSPSAEDHFPQLRELVLPN
jgi:hypothetical protein